MKRCKMSRQLFAFFSAMLLLCPLAFGFFTFGKANVTEVIITQQDDLNGYASEWNYTVDPSPVSDEANNVAVDRHRNIIVVGINKSISSIDTSWLIMKFAPDGSLLWTGDYDFSLSEDSPTGVAVDPDGNITVVGYDRVTTSPTDVEWRFLKLAPDGELLWTNSYNFSSGSDMPWGVAIDSQNNTVAVGYDQDTGSSSDYEWRVVKLAPDGTLLWTHSYNFSSGVDVANAVAVDSLNNIIVVGFDEFADREWRIIRISPDGNSLSLNFPINLGTNLASALGVASDSQNNVIVVGYDSSRGYYDKQWLIIKFDTAGTELWRRTAKDVIGTGTATYTLDDVASGVAVDSFNNVTVVGYFRINDTAPQEYNNQWAILKFGYDGTSLWNYTGNFSPFSDKARAIAFDSYDDIAVVGFDDVAGHNDHQWRIMKFNSLSSNVHNIDTGLNYATIQEAIDAPETLDGHTLLVDAGTYYENVVVNKSLSIVGEDASVTVIDGKDIGNVVTIAANNVNITGLTIQRSGLSFPASGIAINYVNGCNISGNNVESNTCGIHSNRSSEISIYRNKITNNAYGIYLRSSSDNNAIIGNNVTNSDKGIFLKSSSNNNIAKNELTTNDEGIRLDGSSEHNTISENNVRGGDNGIILYENSSYTIINENNVTGSPYMLGISSTGSNNSILTNNLTLSTMWLAMSFNTSVSGNIFVNGGLDIWNSSGNTITDNFVNGKPIIYLEGVSDYSVEEAGQIILVNCTRMKVENLDLSNSARARAVHLWDTSESTIAGNNITGNGGGVRLDLSDDNIILQNRLADNGYGIVMYSSSNNSVSKNAITSNSWSGIWLGYNSFRNEFYENDISNNGLGVELGNSFENKFFHNNFRNVNQIYDWSWEYPYYNWSINAWDYGYPFGGNYWSDYVGEDLNGDGIGDSPYTIDANNTDRYPFMGPFSRSSATSEFDVSTVSNSTVSPVVFDYMKSTLSLNVTGSVGTKGFCRLEIPRSLMQGPYAVMIDGTLINSTELSASNSTHAFIYFTYTHSTHQVVIEPEVLYQIQDLFSKYDQLLADYANLNSSYYKLLNNDTSLAGNITQLTQRFDQLNASYQQHLQDYSDFKANYTLHLGNYSSLRNDFNTLNQSYITLQANVTALSNSYDSLNSTLTDYQQSMQNELSFTRNLVYVFIGITVILLATTVYLAVRKPKTKPET